MRSFWIILISAIQFSSCYTKMSNDPPPPPMEWFSFGVSGFQLKDLLDTLVAKDANLLYDPYQKERIRMAFSLYMADGKDTINYFLHFSGNYRIWLEQPDSSYLALDGILKRPPPPDANSNYLVDDLTAAEEEKYQILFIRKVIDPLRNELANSVLYNIKPLNVADTLEAQWIFCRAKLNLRCDTLWLTSKHGAEYILSDTSVFIPYKY